MKSKKKFNQTDLFAEYGGEDLVLQGEEFKPLNGWGEPVKELDLPTLQDIANRKDIKTILMFT